MSRKQKYVSDELTHFVGRRLPNEEEQYQLLVQIIKSGKLIHNVHFPRAVDSLVMIGGQLSRNEVYYPGVVCFCDIPTEDLQIHMDKYSRFGLSFLKEFLVQKGANPVFYVARNSMLTDPGGTIRVMFSSQEQQANPSDVLQRSMVFDKLVEIYRELEEMVMNPPRYETAPPEIFRLYVRFMDFKWLLDTQVFSFLKFFESTKSEDNAENYYMEREWRIRGQLEFVPSEICRVIVPFGFVERLRIEVPEYSGQITPV